MNADPAYAIWLYGSHARGDADELSDVDILVVSERVDDYFNSEDLYADAKSASVTRYTWDEVERMAQSGSLFLRHLMMEGRALRETPTVKGQLSTALSRLGRYQFAGRDARGFSEVLSDIRESISREGSVAFELATLGTVVRHAAILGCAIADQPCFCRLEPVKRISELWNLPGPWVREFEFLYQYRLYADGRLSAPPLQYSPDFAIRWLDRASAFIEVLHGHLHESH